MPRPKRPGGTFSTEWPNRLNAFFGQHKRLTKKGVALVLNDIAYEQGYRSISAQMLYKYCNANENRRPTDHFMACWEIFEKRLQALKGKELMCRARDGQHLVVWLDGQAEEIWLPPTSQWALHRCKQCKIAYIGQHNSHHCPMCRHPARRD